MYSQKSAFLRNHTNEIVPTSTVCFKLKTPETRRNFCHSRKKTQKSCKKYCKCSIASYFSMIYFCGIINLNFYFMKKITIFGSLLCVITTSFAQVKVSSNGNMAVGTTASPAQKLHVVGNSYFNGNVGVGTANPVQKLHVEGKVIFSGFSGTWDDINIDWNNQYSATQLYCSTYNFTIGTKSYAVGDGFFRYLYSPSDERLKENVKQIQSPLEKLLLVNGKSYNYIDNTKQPQKEKTTQQTFGFIAQELEKVFPELVNAPDSYNEYYNVNYIAMIPILVESIKEQQSMIEKQQTVIEKQQQRIEQLEKSSNVTFPKSLNSNETTATQNVYISDAQHTEALKLYQNAPNPFNERTTVKCYVPEHFQKVQLCVYNMQGVQVQNLFLNRFDKYKAGLLPSSKQTPWNQYHN